MTLPCLRASFAARPQSAHAQYATKIFNYLISLELNRYLVVIAAFDSILQKICVSFISNQL